MRGIGTIRLLFLKKIPYRGEWVFLKKKVLSATAFLIVCSI